MKTTIGGDRLGSGNKQTVNGKNFDRSTHDLSSLWRSSMSAGTLVPFMSLLALPGDNFDIDLDVDVKTLPTIGPLFGSFKVQLDVFQIPIRLYVAELHMNRLNIGMNMANVLLPQVLVRAFDNDFNGANPLDDNAQINSSCLLKYLGIRGIGRVTNSIQANRAFNACDLIGYWDVYKNYYANKQEERGFLIHTDETNILAGQAVLNGNIFNTETDTYAGNIYNQEITIVDPTERWLFVQFGVDVIQPSASAINILIDTVSTPLDTAFSSVVWTTIGGFPGYECRNPVTVAANTEWELPPQNPIGVGQTIEYAPQVVEFPLTNIDDMRLALLQHTPGTVFYIDQNSDAPYGLPLFVNSDGDSNQRHQSLVYSQEGLGLKTYQSDLFNNWISTEWIDGTNGVNEVTAVDTTGDSFTIDAFNLASKVYVMLNRIAISGGSYDDWLDAVYAHERARSIESPMYMGSLIKELAFEEVVSNADTAVNDNTQPLGTLAGRGRLTNKHKGGRIKVRVDEPSYIMGIVSLTPRIDYSQGNHWDKNLKNMDELHKPDLDAIGYQDLITDQMAWQDTVVDATPTPDAVIFSSAGKQPAWINYMTDINETFGNFAVETKEMFMTLNRRYQIGTTGIEDLTTYINPSHFNQIFAQTNLDAQNFWVQISKDITARRKMSAKVIPNL